MPNPKRKHSKSKTRKRRSSKKIRNVPFSNCPNCGAIKLPHFACSKCGYYKGVPVLTIESKK